MEAMLGGTGVLRALAVMGRDDGVVTEVHGGNSTMQNVVADSLGVEERQVISVSQASLCVTLPPVIKSWERRRSGG